MNLPIRTKDYNNIVIINEFINQIKDTFIDRELKFIPTTHGYDIQIETNSKKLVVSIHKPAFPFNRFKVIVKSDLKSEKYNFKHKSEIQNIINDLNIRFKDLLIKVKT